MHKSVKTAFLISQVSYKELAEYLGIGIEEVKRKANAELGADTQEIINALMVIASERGTRFRFH